MRYTKLFFVPVVLAGFLFASCEIPYTPTAVVQQQQQQQQQLQVQEESFEINFDLDGGIDIDTGYSTFPSVKGVVGKDKVTMPIIAKEDQAFLGWSTTGQAPAFDFDDIKQSGIIELKPIYKEIKPLGQDSYFDLNSQYESAYTVYFSHYTDVLDNTDKQITQIYNSSSFPTNLRALVLPASVQRIKAVLNRNNFSTAGTNCKIIFHRTKLFNIRDNIVTVDTNIVSTSGGTGQLLDKPAPNSLLFKDSQVIGLY